MGLHDDLHTVKLYGKNENKIDSLVQSVRIITTDMCVEFGINR